MDQYQASPATFWDEFSVDGKRMSFTAINERLQDLRRIQDDADYKEAIVVYADKFDELFQYRKSGVRQTMKKRMDIAKRFRELRDARK